MKDATHFCEQYNLGPDHYFTIWIPIQGLRYALQFSRKYELRTVAVWYCKLKNPTS